MTKIHATGSVPCQRNCCSDRQARRKVSLTRSSTWLLGTAAGQLHAHPRLAATVDLTEGEGSPSCAAVKTSSSEGGVLGAAAEEAAGMYKW